MSLLSTMMVPVVGASKPAIILRIVVLPQPDGPSSETNSPLSKLRSTPLTTWLSLKVLVMLSILRNGSAMSGPWGCLGGEAAEEGDHAHRAPGEDEGDDRQRRRLVGAVGADVLHIDAEH